MPSSRLRDTCELLRTLELIKAPLILNFTMCLPVKKTTLFFTFSPYRLDRFEKTNEMLINFNGLSNVRLQQMNERFLLHTRTLVDMKKDLDSIFRRIRYGLLSVTKHKTYEHAEHLHSCLLHRTLKGKIAKQYPEAFSSKSTCFNYLHN